MKESPIFIKSYEMGLWVMRHTERFRRNQRFSMAQTMDQAVLHLNSSLSRAAYARGRSRSRWLSDARGTLLELNIANRYCKDLKLFSVRQYGYLAVLLDEVGKLLSAWIDKGSNSDSTASKGAGNRA